jgi:hypothetical protein
MTYIVELYTCDKDHPIWPGETYFRVMNKETREWELGMYVKEEAANKVAKKLNRPPLENLTLNTIEIGM